MMYVWQDEGKFAESAFIPNEPCFVVFSKRGYIKRLSSDNFTVQNRGGRGALPRIIKHCRLLFSSNQSWPGG